MAWLLLVLIGGLVPPVLGVDFLGMGDDGDCIGGDEEEEDKTGVGVADDDDDDEFLRGIEA